MLKHKNIIDKMSVKQKISLLTNIRCLSDPEYTALGIPYTSMARLEDILNKTKEGITSNILARSWNVAGLENVAEALVSEAREEGVNFVISPSPKIKIAPYKSAISEDPYLSGRLVGAYLGASRNMGVPTCVSGFSLDADDVDYLDLKPSQRFIYDYFVAPFKLAVKQSECTCVMGSFMGPDMGYEDVNLGLMRAAGNRLFGTNVNLLCDEHTPEATATVWHEGGIVVNGVSAVLEQAYEKYNKIVRAIHKGHAAVDDLEDAYADGSAISDDMLDLAVSRVIEFAFQCGGDSVDQTEEQTEEKEVRGACVSEKLFTSVRESIVLLKNNDEILPLRKKTRVAIIGDAVVSSENGEFVTALENGLNCPCVGTARGYVMNSDRDEEHIAEALRIASKADVVLLFLSIDGKRLDKISHTKQLELPANQSALLDAMKKYAKKTVAIVGGDILPAAKFADDLAAFVLAPLGGAVCARALADVLTARYNPCGRLTETYYDSPRRTYETIRKNKDTKKAKIGPFMGYRLYDSSDVTVKYPFGYGLSYTKFDYSGLSVSGNSVRLVVRNSGHLRGIETVQVYVGKKDSSYVRPLKELKAFSRVELGPRQSTEIKITVDDLSIYDENSKKYVLENGNYEIYVGTSVSDIKLTGKMTVQGEKVKKEDAPSDKSSDYLMTESNILLDKYTMDARGKYMKRSKKWMICYIIGLILTAISDGILIIAKIIADQNSLILGRSILGFIVVFNVFAISFIVLLIVADIISARRFRKLSEREKLENTKEQFSDAEFLEDVNIDALFVKEFDGVIEKKKETRSHGGFDLSDYSRFVDNDMNLTVAQKALTEHAARLGVTITNEHAANLLAAFATSRLLLLDTANADEIKRLGGVLCSFFETEEYAEEISGEFIDGNLLFAKDSEGAIRRTAMVDMIRSAADKKEKIHFVTLTNVTTDLMTNLFSRYIRFLNNPERECTVFVNDEKFTIPENVWFVMSLNEGESIRNVPAYLSELMSVVNVNYVYEDIDSADDGAEESVAQLAEIPTLGYYQLSFLSEKARNGYTISEELWKKVDSLEEYATKHSSYRFGNKLWLRLEKYLSVLNSCEVEPRTALDYTLSSNIVHVLRSVLEGKLADDDMGLLEALELYFGDDNVSVCRKMLKSSFVK